MTRSLGLRTVIAITKGRGPQMDRVAEAMEELARALEDLPGYPEQGNMATVPEPPLEATLIWETTRAGDIGQQRHPGTTMIFRWWPDHRVPPESQVVGASAR